MKPTTTRIAVFISSHGFGHAARAAAVILAIQRLHPQIAFDIFTGVPEWFFKESHCTNYSYFPCQTDVGLVQKNSMDEDLDQTLDKLATLYPPRAEQINLLAQQIAGLDQFVICDISPIGIAAARAAGLPSVLVENFTWDWIYAGYRTVQPLFETYISLMSDLNQQADFHIQTTPVCWPGHHDLLSNPVSRPFKDSRSDIRQVLGIAPDETSVLVTMGGIEAAYTNLDRFRRNQDIVLILPGASDHIYRKDNLVLLPHHSGIYHPDLLNASDAVVGKLGYSTLSEAYAAGIPYGFIPRQHFIESPPLAEFVLNHMSGMEISITDFETDHWLDILPALLSTRRVSSQGSNGADQIARFLSSLLIDSKDY